LKANNAAYSTRSWPETGKPIANDSKPGISKEICGERVIANEVQGASEWRRHWTVLVPSLAGMILLAVHNYTLGVMIGPLQQEFGWSRAEISAGPFITAFIAVLVAPLVGIGIDRFGPRRIGLFGVLFFCAALALLCTTTADIFSWWLRWSLVGLASMFILPVVWTTAINSFFSKNRGKALAITLCGTGITATFVPTLTNVLVDHYGWRQAYVILAAMCALVVAPLVFFLFYGAEDRQRGARATSNSQQSVTPLTGVAVREGVLSPTFMKLAGAIICFSTVGCAMTTNAVPVLLSQGFDRSTAAAIAGLIGIGSITGRLVGGVLLDHFDAKKVAAASVIFPIVTILIFLLSPGALWPAMIAAAVLGLSVGAEVDVCAYLTARHFGMRSFGTLFGIVSGLLLFTNGITPIIANHIYDVTGSYQLVLWTLVPLSVLSGLLFLWLGRYPDFSEAADHATVQVATLVE
jgi:MFS family permease